MRTTRRTFIAGTCAVTTGLFAPSILRAQSPLAFTMGSPMTGNHPTSTAIEAAVAAIRKETGDAVQINFFPNSALGSEASMQSQLRSGAIQFAVHSCTFLQTLVPVAGLPTVPFAFDGYKTLWASLNGDLGAIISTDLEKAGMRPFKIVDAGFRHTTNSVRPITSVDDMRGLKIRVPPAPMLTAFFSLMGAAPATITLGELYSALQTKIVDGMEGSLINLDAINAPEVQKYCSKTGHAWDGLWILGRSATWKDLPEEVRAVIERHLTEAAVSQQQESERVNSELEPVLTAKGLAFNQPDRTKFRARLNEAGFYEEWKAKFGADAWGTLETYTGPLAV